MLHIRVTPGPRALERQLGAFAEPQQRRILAAALNKTGDKARTTARQLISTEGSLSAKATRSRLTRSRASRTALVYSVLADGRPVSLAEYKAPSWSKRNGVKVTVNGRRVHLPGAFIAKVGSDPENLSRGIFLRGRVSDAIGRKDRNRRAAVPRRVGRNRSELPIDKLFGLTAADHVDTRKGLAKLHSRVRAEFATELERALRRELNRRRPS